MATQHSRIHSQCQGEVDLPRHLLSDCLGQGGCSPYFRDTGSFAVTLGFEPGEADRCDLNTVKRQCCLQQTQSRNGGSPLCSFPLLWERLSYESIEMTLDGSSWQDHEATLSLGQYDKQTSPFAMSITNMF